MTPMAAVRTTRRWPLHAMWFVEAALVGVLMVLSWHNYPPMFPTLATALLFGAFGFGLRVRFLGWNGIPTSLAASAGFVALCIWPLAASVLVTTDGFTTILDCHQAGVTGIGTVDRWALPAGEYCTDQFSGRTFLSTPTSTLIAIYCALGVSAAIWLGTHRYLRRFPTIASTHADHGGELAE